MAIRFDPTTRTLWLSIGDLLTPTVFPGSIQSPTRFRTRAALGKTVHERYQTAQQAKYTSYRAEVTIRQQLQVDNYTVYIHGRIDGLYEQDDQLIVEEIKSVLMPPERFAALTLEAYPTYERQLLLYIGLLRQQHCGMIQGHLTLINIADDACHVYMVDPTPHASSTLLMEQVRAILTRCEARAVRAQRRQPQLLRFPFVTMHPSQATIMERVRQTLQNQGCLMLEAPTGAGKTVAALYPTLEYALMHGLRVCFVTAKTTQQLLAVETLKRIAAHSAQFTAVHLRAKAKSCLSEIYYCHENVCEFAQNYGAKLDNANLLTQMLALSVVEPHACTQAGQRYRVCPFELSLDIASEADVIIGDYNYVFDPGTYLRRFFQETPHNDWILIIDEAHNLPGRARDYYSPVLLHNRIQELLVHCAHNSSRLWRDFTAWFRTLEALLLSLPDRALEAPTTNHSLLVSPPLEAFVDLRYRLETLMVDYAIYRHHTEPASGEDPIQDFYYSFQRLCDVLAVAGEEFSYLYRQPPEGGMFKVLCKDAARFLQERLQGFHSVIAMSATLQPFAFYQDVLGLPAERTDTATVPSAFPNANRLIAVVPHTTTAYRERQREAPKTARIIETIVAQHAGNYGVFFPSFAYLRLVRSLMRRTPSQRIIMQTETMSEAERITVLQRLQHNRQDSILLLAVQGGIFAEGVDYPGAMLTGVIVVGPGFPRVDEEQELIRAYYDQRYAHGFAYTYLYPGMHRVIQAAGRVIRTATDVGIVILLDKRFTYNNYMALLPSYWYQHTPRELITRDYQHRVAAFWARHTPPPTPE